MRFPVLPVLAVLAVVPASADDRSFEVVRYDCTTDTTRREVTLFGNGTIRLRDGQIGNEWMGLTELGPDELQGFLNRLSGEDLSESPNPERGVEGAWIERCELRLHLPGQPLKTYRFGHYDPLALNLSHVVRIAQELAEKVPDLRDTHEGQLPVDYEPEPGDVLKRTEDGARFRVVTLTSDGKGVELRGIDLPLELYVPKDQMRKNFTELVSRGW